MPKYPGKLTHRKMTALIKVIQQKDGFGKPEKNHPEDEIVKKTGYLIPYKSHAYELFDYQKFANIKKLHLLNFVIQTIKRNKNKA